MAISKVGLGWPVGERQYARLYDWHSAKNMSAEFEEALCMGDIGGTQIGVSAAQYPNGCWIHSAVQYDGSNHADLAVLNASFACVNTGGNLLIEDIVLLRGSLGYAISIGNAGNIGRRLYIKHTSDPGANAGAIHSINLGVLENCVVVGTNPTATRLIRPTGTGIIKNCVAVGGNRGVNTEWTATEIVNCYAAGSTSADYFYNNGKPPKALNNASEDETGIAGLTGHNPATTFVDYANEDYRIRTTSPLHAAGIGAFFEQSAPAENIQAHTSGGTLNAISTATAITSQVNSQQLATNGQTICQTSAAATTSVVNNQTVATSATAQTITTAQAVTTPVNAQRHNTSGKISAVATAIAQSAIVNHQTVSTSATGNQIFTGYAITVTTNDTGSVQHATSGATLIGIGAASTSTSAANIQNKTTGASATGVFTATANTSWVNQLPQLAALIFELKTRTKFIQNIETSGRHTHQVKTKTRYHYQLKTRSGG